MNVSTKFVEALIYISTKFIKSSIEVTELSVALNKTPINFSPRFEELLIESIEALIDSIQPFIDFIKASLELTLKRSKLGLKFLAHNQSQRFDFNFCQRHSSCLPHHFESRQQRNFDKEISKSRMFFELSHERI